MGAPLNVELPEATAERVSALAARERRTVAEMVRLLAEEALALREFPEITFVDGPTGRRARLVHGPDVWEVLEPYLVAGKDWQALRESYPDLDESLLRAVLRYYAAYPEEIEARVARNQAG
jgi:hypothetical protein